MKKLLFLVIALLGAGQANAYKYKFINMTKRTLWTRVYFDAASPLEFDLKPWEETTKSRGALLAHEIKVTDRNEIPAGWYPGKRGESPPASVLDLEYSSGASRAGDLTFLMFDDKSKHGPYVQFKPGIHQAWNPESRGASSASITDWEGFKKSGGRERY